MITSIVTWTLNHETIRPTDAQMVACENTCGVCMCTVRHLVCCQDVPRRAAAIIQILQLARNESFDNPLTGTATTRLSTSPKLFPQGLPPLLLSAYLSHRFLRQLSPRSEDNNKNARPSIPRTWTDPILPRTRSPSLTMLFCWNLASTELA
jgi:hypothetical protein